MAAVSKPNSPDIRAASAGVMAVIGLITWSLNTYVFKHGVPGPVATAIYVLVPGIIGYLMSHVSLYRVPMEQTTAAAQDIPRPIINLGTGNSQRLPDDVIKKLADPNTPVHIASDLGGQGSSTAQPNWGKAGTQS